MAYAHVGLIYPSGGETFSPGDVITIKWLKEIDHGDCTWELYYSFDHGITWQIIKTGIQKSQTSYDWTIPNDLANSFCQIKVVQNNTLGSDYFDKSNDFEITSLTTGITSEKSSINKFILYPAYPNPFNPTTKISYDLPEQSMVKIIVYNTLGIKIAELTNNIQQSGNHNFVWNAQDLSSGFYFLNIEAVTIQSKRTFNKTIKMILLK